jgi:acetylornithine deacetylase
MDVVDLTMDLCRVDSPTGLEAAVCSLAARHARALGLDVRGQRVDTDGRDNLLCVDPSVPPQVILTTHLDVVPPYIAPTEHEDRLTGRGTCDAKGAAASMFCAVQQLRAQGEKRVGLMFLVGEEGQSDGAKHAAATGFAPTVRYFINGEPTGMRLASAQKGTLSFTLAAHGVAAHSAYPELGRNAIHALVAAMHNVLNEPWPTSTGLGDTTVNVGMLEGGVATNVLAPAASARGIFRLAVPRAGVEQRLRSLMPQHVELKVTGGTDPVEFHVPVGMEGDVVRFGSDVPYLRGMGTPLMLGPGSIHDAHTAHEFVMKADLLAATARYADLCRMLLG